MAAPKKVMDSWKTKSWYTIVAPKFLNEVEVTQVPALEDETLLNRILVLPLKDITRSLAHMNMNVKLRVEEIKGKTAYTKFIGHEVAREYIRTLIRRGRDVLVIVFPAVSKDGVEFKVKATVLTANKISGKQRKAVHREFVTHLREIIKQKDFGNFILDTLNGKTAQEMGVWCKRVVPLRRVEIHKTELKEVFDTPEIVAPETLTQAAPESPKEGEVAAESAEEQPASA